MKKIVDLNDLSLEQIQDIIDEAIAFKKGKTIDYHQKKVVANLFLSHQQEHIIVLIWLLAIWDVEHKILKQAILV